jgi:hypothetical protein
MTRAGGRTIAVHLSLAEAGLVLEALAELPFKSVYALIGELNRQANAYDPSEFGADSAQRYAFAPSDLRLVLAALGNLPYRRVSRLVHKLDAQIMVGLDALETAP